MPIPIDPFSFSPPDRPTTHIVMSLLGPPTAVESPRRNVKPPETNKQIKYHSTQVQKLIEAVTYQICKKNEKGGN